MIKEKTEYEKDIEKQKLLFDYIQDKTHLKKRTDYSEDIKLESSINAIIDIATNVNVKKLLHNFYYGSSFKIDDKTFTYQPGTIPIIIPDIVNTKIDNELTSSIENETININELKNMKEQFNNHTTNYIRVHNLEHLATILSLYDPDYLFFNDETFSSFKRLNLQLLDEIIKDEKEMKDKSKILGGSKKIRSKPTIINDHRMRKYAIINDMKYQILNEIENGKLILCDSKNNIKVY